MAKQGKFITVEGIEGAGKSTQIHTIGKYLREQDIDLVVTREPGGTPLGEKIRDLLLRSCKSGLPISDKSELMLIFAARAEHLEKIIIPALAAGQWVLCDRFTDATFAYQGFGRGIDTQLIKALESLTQGDIRPDHTIYLDISVEQGLERARLRGIMDRFEKENQIFFERVKAGYLERAGQFPDIFHIVDGAGSIEEVSMAITKVCTRIFASND